MSKTVAAMISRSLTASSQTGQPSFVARQAAVAACQRRADVLRGAVTVQFGSTANLAVSPSDPDADEPGIRVTSCIDADVRVAQHRMVLRCRNNDPRNVLMEIRYLKWVPTGTSRTKEMVSFPNESAEYRAARDRLLEKEIGLRRAMEEVAAARRALPKGGLAQDYVFDGFDLDGRPTRVKLSEQFAPGRDTLIVYSMMFPRHKDDTRAQPQTGAFAEMPREQTPCPSCTALLDQLDPAVMHLKPAGFNFAVIAKAPIERLRAYAKERGWKHMQLLSSANNSFNHDYHAEFEDGEQAPMISVFRRDADGIRHFWSSEMLFAPSDPGQDPRHAGTIEPLWTLMDLTPDGRPDFDEQVEYGCCC
jgi:predicted dithiol-disulfide oxidoreductase (DUF899 family)